MKYKKHTLTAVYRVHLVSGTISYSRRACIPDIDPPHIARGTACKCFTDCCDKDNNQGQQKIRVLYVQSTTYHDVIDCSKRHGKCSTPLLDTSGKQNCRQTSTHTSHTACSATKRAHLLAWDLKQHAQLLEGNVVVNAARSYHVVLHHRSFLETRAIIKPRAVRDCPTITR